MVDSVSSDPLDADNPDVELLVNPPVDGEAASEEEEQTSEPENEQEQEQLAPPAPEPDKKTEKLEKRFSELTHRRNEAMALAEQERQARLAIETELEKYRQSPANQKPVYENFADPYTYAEALAQYESNKVRAETEQKIRSEYQQKQEQERVANWQAKQAAAKADYEDYDLVVNSATAVISNALQEAILESDLGPHLLYKLADDDALVAKLNRLPTTSAIRELGKIEASIEAARSNRSTKSVKGSSAPAPISPIRQSNVIRHDVMPSGDVIIDNLDNYRKLRQAGKIR